MVLAMEKNRRYNNGMTLQQRLSSLFGYRQKTILGAATIIMITVAASRILGLIRIRLLAHYFGASYELAAYIAAFRLPDTIFELLVGGAISVAFIPVFTSFLAQDKKEEAWEVACSLINVLIASFIVLSLFIFIFAQPLVNLIAPGLVKESPQTLPLMTNLTRMMLISEGFLILASFLTSILHSFQRFLVPAIAPLLYNLGIILGLIFLAPFIGIYAAAIGVIFGAVLYFLIQLPLSLRMGFSWRPVLNIRHPGVKEIGKLMVPRTVGIAATQAQSIIDLYLSSLLMAKSMVAFSFAQTLSFVPVGVFGVALGQAVLPSLSFRSASKESDSFKDIFLLSFHQLLFLVMPVVAILIVLRIPVVRLVFGAARFDWEATVLTGRTLALFALGVAPAASIQILARAFYALHDTTTPVKISLITMGLNIIMSVLLILILNLPIWGLALSASLSSLFQAIALLALLSKKSSGLNFLKLFFPSLKIILAAVLMAFFLYVPMKLLDQLVFDTTRTINLILLTGIATTVGLIVYIFLAWFLEIEEVATFLNLARKAVNIRQILVTPSEATGSEA
jgi:putative peptidoglycan lipid II flippase